MRYLLVDQILDLAVGDHIRALKNVTASDAFAVTRASGHIVLPASMMLEAMAQAAGLLVAASWPDAQPLLAKVNGFQTNAEARPGTRLLISARLAEARAMEGCALSASAESDDGLRAEATIYLALVPFAGEAQRDEARARLKGLFPQIFARA